MSTKQRRRWPFDADDTQLIGGVALILIAAALLSLKVLFVFLILAGLALVAHALLKPPQPPKE